MFRVQSGRYTFAAAEVRDDESGMWRVSFGGRRQCSTACVYDGDPLAHLGGVVYHERCALDTVQAQAQARSPRQRGLPPGEGTVAMVRAFMAFLCGRPYGRGLQGFTLRDTSAVESRVVPGLKVSLPVLHAVKHGRTWYMQHFGAVPLDEDTRASTLEQLARVPTLGLPASFDAFYEAHVRRQVRDVLPAALQQQLPTALRHHYGAGGGSLGGFVRSAAAALDCWAFAGWLDAYVRQRAWLPDGMLMWMVPRGGAPPPQPLAWVELPEQQAAALGALAERNSAPQARAREGARPGREDPLFDGFDDISTPSSSPSPPDSSSSQDGGGRCPPTSGQYEIDAAFSSSCQVA